MSVIQTSILKVHFNILCFEKKLLHFCYLEFEGMRKSDEKINLNKNYKYFSPFGKIYVTGPS